jgi:hypothetical protein
VIGVFALVVACGADHEWPRFLRIMDDDDRVQRCCFTWVLVSVKDSSHDECVYQECFRVGLRARGARVLAMQKPEASATQITDHRSPITDHRSSTTDSRSPSPDHR